MTQVKSIELVNGTAKPGVYRDVNPHNPLPGYAIVRPGLKPIYGLKFGGNNVIEGTVTIEEKDCRNADAFELTQLGHDAGTKPLPNKVTLSRDTGIYVDGLRHYLVDPNGVTWAAKFADSTLTVLHPAVTPAALSPSHDLYYDGRPVAAGDTLTYVRQRDLVAGKADPGVYVIDTGEPGLKMYAIVRDGLPLFVGLTRGDRIPWAATITPEDDCEDNCYMLRTTLKHDAGTTTNPRVIILTPTTTQKMLVTGGAPDGIYKLDQRFGPIDIYANVVDGKCYVINTIPGTLEVVATSYPTVETRYAKNTTYTFTRQESLWFHDGKLYTTYSEDAVANRKVSPGVYTYADHSFGEFLAIVCDEAVVFGDLRDGKFTLTHRMYTGGSGRMVRIAHADAIEGEPKLGNKVSLPGFPNASSEKT